MSKWRVASTENDRRMYDGSRASCVVCAVRVGGGKADAQASPCAGERLIVERGDYSFAALLCDRVPSSGGIPCYQVRHLLVFWLRVGPLAPLTCPADTHLYTRGVFAGLFSLVTFSVFI